MEVISLCTHRKLEYVMINLRLALHPFVETGTIHAYIMINFE